MLEAMVCATSRQCPLQGYCVREQYVTQSGQNTICNGMGRRGAWEDWAIGKGFDEQTEESGLVRRSAGAITGSGKVSPSAACQAVIAQFRTQRIVLWSAK